MSGRALMLGHSAAAPPPSGDTYGDSFVAEVDELMSVRIARAFDGHQGGWSWGVTTGSENVSQVTAAFNAWDMLVNNPGTMCTAPDLGSGDMYVEATIGQVAVHTNGGLALRIQNGGELPYQCYYLEVSSATRLRLRSYDDGARVTVLQYDGPLNVGDVVRAEVVGTNFEMFLNGNSESTNTNTTFSGGLAGLHGIGNRDAVFQKFNCGAL